MSAETRDIVRWMALQASNRDTDQMEGTLQEAIAKSQFHKSLHPGNRMEGGDKK